MNLRNMLISAILFCLTIPCSESLLAQESFTIYLVRHAEKSLEDKSDRNPELTDCGRQRAESLAYFFEQVDIHDVYSSNYSRTISTAQPVADSKNTKIQIFDPKQTESFAKILKQTGKNALVIGHSNSTPSLANALLQQADAFPQIDESEYNDILQIVFMGDQVQATVFKSNFRCRE